MNVEDEIESEYFKSTSIPVKVNSPICLSPKVRSIKMSKDLGLKRIRWNLDLKTPHSKYTLNKEMSPLFKGHTKLGKVLRNVNGYEVLKEVVLVLLHDHIKINNIDSLELR